MVFIFLILCLYALLHFIFESIVAPSARFNIRLDLFALRDEARRLRIKSPEIGDEAFGVVQDGLNAAIKYLYEIDILILVHCDVMVNRDKRFKERVEKRRAVVMATNSSELIYITNQLRKKVESAALINNGGWLLYVIPILFAALVLKRACAPIFSVLYLSNHELEKIFPEKRVELAAA